MCFLNADNWLCHCTVLFSGSPVPPQSKKISNVKRSPFPALCSRPCTMFKCLNNQHMFHFSLWEMSITVSMRIHSFHLVTTLCSTCPSDQTSSSAAENSSWSYCFPLRRPQWTAAQRGCNKVYVGKVSHFFLFPSFFHVIHPSPRYLKPRVYWMSPTLHVSSWRFPSHSSSLQPISGTLVVQSTYRQQQTLPCEFLSSFSNFHW